MYRSATDSRLDPALPSCGLLTVPPVSAAMHHPRPNARVANARITCLPAVTRCIIMPRTTMPTERILYHGRVYCIWYDLRSSLAQLAVRHMDIANHRT